jgi:hypothetical protein
MVLSFVADLLGSIQETYWRYKHTEKHCPSKQSHHASNIYRWLLMNARVEIAEGRSYKGGILYVLK